MGKEIAVSQLQVEFAGICGEDMKKSELCLLVETVFLGPVRNATGRISICT